MYENLYQGIYAGLNPYMQPDLNTLIAQAQKLQSQNPYNPANQPNQAMTNRGDYVVIKDYKEVETTPARADGIATLFFDWVNMVFYSKKLSNGKAVIQNFNFSVSNSMIDNDNATQTPQESKENQPVTQNNDKIDILLDYVEKLENKLNTTVKEINKLKKSNKVVEGNEI